MQRKPINKEIMIKFEKEICEHLRLPSIPKREWNGTSQFKNYVAVVNTIMGEQVYAVVSYDPEKDKSPRVVKVFGQERFIDIEHIYVVPEYMDVSDIQHADLDDESKKKAEELAKEAEEIENEGVEDGADIDKLPEWIFDHIKNRHEAEAYLRSYRKTNKIKGNIPKTEENLKLALYVIYKEMQNKNK